MRGQSVTFANPLGEWLAPMLLTLRAGGAFEASVYIPAMTIVSVLLYAVLHVRLHASDRPELRRHRWLRVAGYFAVCFLLTNSLAVAFKTLILEEIDYQEPLWLARLVSPLHFYIASVAAAYLWLIARGRHGRFEQALGYHVQAGLVGGYAVASYRMLFERFTLSDPTMAIGGLTLGVMFAVYHVDLRRHLSKDRPDRSGGHQVAIS